MNGASSSRAGEISVDACLQEADLLPWNGVPGGDSTISTAFASVLEAAGGDGSDVRP
jgi:hypothetical protein